MERRMTTGGEIRIEERDGKKVVTGYGAVFYREGDAGSEYKMFSDLTERIAPTAFARAIREKQDVRGLYNHDPSALLGRSAAGTMRLLVDKRGLGYEIDLPDTQVGRDVATSIARGDLTGSSFGFRVVKQSFMEQKDGPDLRMIEDVDLFDVGPVTYPAYGSTTTGLRSDDSNDAIAARDQWRRLKEADSVAVRIRSLSLDNEPALS